VKLWVYFALLAAAVACFGVIEAVPSGRPYTFLLLLVLFVLGYLWWRSHVDEEAQEREYRRTYEASSEATYTALRGALGDLDYKVTVGDPDTGTLQFTGGKLGPWIPRLPVECTASVRQLSDRESEIVIAGRECPPQRQGWFTPPQGLSGSYIYPEGMRRRAARILDEVDAAVITYSILDAAPADDPL
jgi:hypothetical protein